MYIQKNEIFIFLRLDFNLLVAGACLCPLGGAVAPPSPLRQLWAERQRKKHGNNRQQNVNTHSSGLKQPVFICSWFLSPCPPGHSRVPAAPTPSLPPASSRLWRKWTLREVCLPVWLNPGSTGFSNIVSNSLQGSGLLRWMETCRESRPWSRRAQTRTWGTRLDIQPWWVTGH